MLLLLSFWKVRRILYLEKGSVFYHGIFISVIWQDDLEGMCPKSPWKYNADKNVNADTSQLNGKWLDNLISLWSPLLCKLSKSERLLTDSGSLSFKHKFVAYLFENTQCSRNSHFSRYNLLFHERKYD